MGWPNVCAFRFIPLRPSTGNLTLLANPCDAGANPDIYIVDRIAVGFEFRDVTTFRYGDGDVGNGPVDILGNGTLELVLDAQLTDYEGAGHCAATWPVVYAWTGSSYTNVSAQSQFQPFYQQQISSLQNQLATSPNDDCLKAEIAKLQRFAGTSDAGMSDATNWANSSDPKVREFASAVLAEIGTSQALPYLQALAHDSNSAVAGIAQHFISTGPYQPDTIDQETMSNPGGL
jgi:hypothetical protein